MNKYSEEQKKSLATYLLMDGVLCEFTKSIYVQDDKDVFLLTTINKDGSKYEIVEAYRNATPLCDCQKRLNEKRYNNEKEISI